MFSHKSTTEFREGRIIIKDSTIAAVRQMIHYMYTGKVSDDYDRDENTIPLMAIAHKYQIKPLIDFNERILVERFVHSHNCGSLNYPRKHYPVCGTPPKNILKQNTISEESVNKFMQNPQFQSNFEECLRAFEICRRFPNRKAEVSLCQQDWE
jgi:hypothetical protein